MENQIEIERKWILKRLPHLKCSKVIYIEQYYTEDGIRYRSEYSFDTDTTKYYKLRKQKIGISVNNETELQEINSETFYTNTTNCKRCIYKDRSLYKLENGLISEIDLFLDLKLIIMEVELEYEGQEVKFPKEIEDVIIMEVTGIEAFDNFNLAE